METTNLKIGGMTCEMCVSHVTKALQNVAGVQNVEVSLPGSARVQHDNASRDAMMEAVREEGYEAELVS